MRKLFFFSAAFIVLLQPTNTVAVRLVESVIATPSLLFVKQKQREVIIRASIPPDPDLILKRVRLWILDGNGNPKRVVKQLRDDGKIGDEFADDGIFTTLSKLSSKKPQTLRFRVCAEYQNLPSPDRPRRRPSPERVCSTDIVEIRFTEQPFFIPPEPDKIVEDNGAFYPVNRAVIILPLESGRDVAEVIAAEIGGRIVGEYPFANAYLLEVPTETTNELDRLIDQLRRDQRISLASKNTGMGSEYFAE